MRVKGDAAALDVLRVAEIRPERQGRARTRWLSPVQRRLYFWILRQFAAATPPTGAAAHAAADALSSTPQTRFVSSRARISSTPTRPAGRLWPIRSRRSRAAAAS